MLLPLGYITNQAEILSFNQFDPDSTPNNSSLSEDDDDTQKVYPLGTPLLNITNTVNNLNPNVGSNVVFTITVSNPSTSLSSATNVVVDALLPAGLTYVSYPVHWEHITAVQEFGQ